VDACEVGARKGGVADLRAGAVDEVESFIRKCAEYAAVDAGFHTTVLPIRAALPGRFPPIAVKLNGVTANTNPSSGRYSILFQLPGEDIGCSL
jgi:hypothetical protein